jgi:hypothetical protein
MVEHMPTILWRFMVYPGYEFCRLFQAGSEWHLEGTAVFSYEHRPCRLAYHVICDAAWHTLSARVEGRVGQDEVALMLVPDRDQRWWLNEDEVQAVRGCTDIDLNFSPSTNIIPIKRLHLAVGETAEVKAAWLKFPSFKLEPLQQRYSRLEEMLYRYESGSGQFRADLRTNQDGFVIDYPDIWTAEAASE